MTSKAGGFTLLYFASAQSYTKQEKETIPAPMSIGKLFEHLETKYPGITSKVLSSSALTINLEYVDVQGAKDTTMINAGDEVAIIPPVSSG